MLDFQNIVLTASELKSLRRLASEIDILLKEFPDQDAFRLVDLEFASLKQFDSPSKGSPHFLHFEPQGRDYLMYWSGVEAQRKLEANRHRVTTCLSILALLISIVSLLSDIGLFQLIQSTRSTPAATSIPVECANTQSTTYSPTIAEPKESALPDSLPAVSVSRDSGSWSPQ